MRDVHDPTSVTPICFDGVIDADGHILEPPTLWEDYLETPLRDRALRVRINDEGLEYLELDGRPSPSHRPGILSELGRTNDSELGGPARRYLDELPYGSMDPAAAALELQRAVNDGCRGAFIGSWTHNRKAPGHPIYDPVWQVAQDLNVPISIHPTAGPADLRPKLFRGVLMRDYSPHVHMRRDNVRQAFTTFFDYATFDRFPTLTVVALESGAGWIGHTLDRLDELHAMHGKRAELQHKPSEYFARQCYISCDPAERTIAAMMQLYGADRFFWASDYPHPDHSIDYLRQMETLDASARAGLLGANVARCYNIASTR